jgi:1-acyl-sn-glycerol-3-phosphate acyltransferase
LFYWIVKAIFSVIARLFFNLRIEGTSNIPDTGPVVVCSNHVSWWDPPLVSVASPRKVSFMAKKELFQYPIFGYLLRKLGAFPVNRGKADIGSIRTALKVLENQEVLGIFPEGTRQRETKTLGKLHSGATLLALKGSAPVVPMVIRGSYGFRQTMTIKMGPPINIEAKTGKAFQDVADGTNQIEEAMMALITSIDDQDIA